MRAVMSSELVRTPATLLASMPLSAIRMVLEVPSVIWFMRTVRPHWMAPFIEAVLAL